MRTIRTRLTDGAPGTKTVPIKLQRTTEREAK